MAQIVLDPVVVALRSGTVDVIAEAILAKDGGEGSSPGDVVRLVEVEDDWHAVEDVDPVDNRRSGQLKLYCSEAYTYIHVHPGSVTA